MKPDVAVIIVSYNSERQIGECLESCFAQCQRVTQEVIVLDNNSTDGTVALIREQYPQVRLVTPGRNLGFAAGVNLAVTQTEADYVLLLNPDTVLLEQATDVVVEFARRHPEYGMYGGRTLRPDGSLEPSSCWGQPTLWSTFLFGTGLSTLFPRNRYFDPESLGSWPRDTVREVGVITGCFLLVERAAWQRLGGFDERYFMYGEDVDLAMRGRLAGLRPVICPDARLVHEVGQSSATPAAKMLLLFRGKASLIRTHWRGVHRALGLMFLQMGVALRALLAATTALVTGRTSNGRWEAVWRARDTWLPGYPEKPSTAWSPAAAPHPAHS